MSDTVALFDAAYRDVLDKATKLDPDTDEATIALKNLKTLTECRPPTPDPEPESVPEPTTVLGKLKYNLAGVWDSETTRVLIKAGGAFAGVVLVTWTTVHRDHVLTRDALSQANQRNS